MRRKLLDTYAIFKNSGLIKNRKGSTLVIAMMVLVVLSILIAAFLNISLFEEKTAVSREKHEQAYYLARSGQEIAYSMVKGNQGELNSLPEYIYGSLDGNFTIVRGNSNWQQNHGNESIVALIEGNNGAGTITSFGNVNGIVEKVVFTFTYNLIVTPDEPPPPPPDVLSAGSSDGDIVSWYASNTGDLKAGTGDPVDGAVSFQNGNNNDPYAHGVITQQNNSSTLSASSMYFLDTLTSLTITKNSTLTLNTDLLAFSGYVDIQGHNQNSHDGQLFLHVFKSTINGSQLIDNGAAANGVNRSYGVVYFGSAVRLDGVPFTGITPNNYYFFPDGANIGSQADINRLIPISDLSKINFAALGVSQSAGGINPGLYK